MVEGLITAFGEAAITYNFLQDRVYPILEERAERRFASEGDEMTGKWSPLTPFTQEMRAQGGFGPAGPINVRTGAMKRHILQREPEAIPMPTGGTLYFPKRGGAGKTLQKMRTAQQGEKKSGTPPRPVVGVSVRDMELILVALAAHIAQNQNGAAMGSF